MYPKLIGKLVWNKGQHLPIWENDYHARIEMSDCDLFRPDDGKIHCDRIDILYDGNLGDGEIKGVWIDTYVDGESCFGTSSCTLTSLPVEMQKMLYRKLSKMIA